MNSSHLKSNNWLKYDSFYLTDPFETKIMRIWDQKISVICRL